MRYRINFYLNILVFVYLLRVSGNLRTLFGMSMGRMGVVGLYRAQYTKVHTVLRLLFRLTSQVLLMYVPTASPLCLSQLSQLSSPTGFQLLIRFYKIKPQRDSGPYIYWLKLLFPLSPCESEKMRCCQEVPDSDQWISTLWAHLWLCSDVNTL